MFEILRSILIAIVVIFLGTSRGRKFASIAAKKAVRNHIHKIPMRYRLLVIGKAFSLPYPSLTRRLLKMATSPVGDENQHIATIAMDSFHATWIGPYIGRLKNAEEWIAQNAAWQADAVILYFHGGGFRHGHSTQYMASFLEIINRLQNKHGMWTLILSVEYSLSPESVWPTAQKECVNAYLYLIFALGIASSKIIVAGDSAGGWLTAEAILTMRDQRRHKELADLPPISLPAGCVMISPLVTMEMDSPTYKTNIETDYIRPEALKSYIDDYLPQLSTMNENERAAYLKNPFISPIYADYTGFCPTLLAIGGGEVFRHDLEKLFKRLKDKNVQAEVLMRDKAPHVWLVDPALSCTREEWIQDIDKIVDWSAKVIQRK